MKAPNAVFLFGNALLTGLAVLLTARGVYHQFFMPAFHSFNQTDYALTFYGTQSALIVAAISAFTKQPRGQMFLACNF